MATFIHILFDCLETECWSVANIDNQNWPLNILFIYLCLMSSASTGAIIGCYNNSFKIHHLWYFLGSSSVLGLSTIRQPHLGDPAGVDQVPACVQVALHHPQFSSSDPQTPWRNFCCLGGQLDGPSPTGPYDSQQVVGPAEELTCEPSASHLNGFAPHSPPIALPLFH